MGEKGAWGTYEERVQRASATARTWGPQSSSMVDWVKSLISRWVLNAGGSQYVVRVDILMETLGCQAPSTAWAKSSLLSLILQFRRSRRPRSMLASLKGEPASTPLQSAHLRCSIYDQKMSKPWINWRSRCEQSWSSARERVCKRRSRYWANGQQASEADRIRWWLWQGKR